MRKCATCGRDVPFLQSSCPYHWDKLDFSIAKSGMFILGIMICIFFVLMLGLVSQGNFFSILIMAIMAWFFLRIIRINNSLRAATTIGVSDAPRH